MTKRKETTSRDVTEKGTLSEEPIIKVPHPEASPREIREYLVHSLINKHDVPPDSAQEMAGRWKHGRGWDLREMRDAPFRELFGEEVAPYLRRTINQEVREEREAVKQAAVDAWKEQAAHAAIVSFALSAAIVYFYQRVSITVGIITTAQMWVLFTGPLDAKTFGDVFFLCIVFYCYICALLVGGFLSGW